MCRQVTVGTGGPTTWACEDTAPRLPQGPAVGIWPCSGEIARGARQGPALAGRLVSGERTMTVRSWLWPPCCGAKPCASSPRRAVGKGCHNACFHFSGALIQVCTHKALSCQ